MLLKGQNILNGGAAEAVNGLVVITHHANVLKLVRQQRGEHILGVVGVLVLVHHHIAELVLVQLQHIVILSQQLHGVVDHIVKVHSVRRQQLLLIERIALGDLPLTEVRTHGSPVLLGTDQRVLGVADLRQNGPVVQKLVVNAQLALALLHHPLAVVRVINGKVVGIAQPIPKPAQDPRAAGVEGVGPNGLRLRADGVCQSLADLSRRLIGKGNGQHLPRQGVAVGNNMLHPVNQHGGLAAAGPGQDQQGTLGVLHRLLLHLVKCHWCSSVYKKITNKKGAKSGRLSPPDLSPKNQLFQLL